MHGNKRNILTNAQRKAIALLVQKDVLDLSYREIAEELGISIATLWNWRHSPHFADELIKQAEQVQRAFLNDTYQKLRGLIDSSDVTDGNKLKAIEIMLKNQGRLKDVQESTVTVQEKSLDDILHEIRSND